MSDQKPDQNELMFIGLLQSFVSSAWIQLGRQENPVTGKTEINLKEAQFTIDTLEMIKKKTTGNLSDKEQQILKSALADLKLKFVELKMKNDSDNTEDN
ncbi:MAG: DUF1844 domain-containing protein [Candidatus Marinimicrobia bacterium]|nr:DUF1844 domain-containing protein [Candidatus Neomarinimicrobiota bacterium]